MAAQTTNALKKLKPIYYNVEAKGPLLDKVYSLRYKSYYSKNFIESNTANLFMDQYDTLGNSRSFLTYLDGQTVGSVRCVHYQPNSQNHIPVMEIFAEEIEKAIGWDKKILEVNRFVVHPDYHGRQGAKLKFNIFKNVALEILETQPDCMVVGVREEHVKFYRCLAFEQVSKVAKQYPNTHFKTQLLACHNLDKAVALAMRMADR